MDFFTENFFFYFLCDFYEILSHAAGNRNIKVYVTNYTLRVSQRVKLRDRER